MANKENNEPIVEARASSLTQLISQAREIVDNLLNLKLDSISGSVSKLQDFLHIIAKLQEEYIKQGTEGILNKIAGAVMKIQTIIERSAEISSVLHIDISDCIEGQEEEIKSLGKNLVAHFTNEATTIINKAVENVNNSKKIITDFAEEISGLPAKLSSNLITWNPMPVIKEFIDYVTELASKIPEQVSNIILDTTEIINKLPSELLICVNDTVQKAEHDADQMLRIIAGNISIKFGQAIIEYLLK